jgi:hypothetical protein
MQGGCKMFSLEWSGMQQSDIARTLEFFARLDADGKRFFSSDDFRAYKLDRHFDKPDKQVGMLFAKLKANGFIVARGEVPSEIESNHFRKNDLWERTGRFEKWMLEQRRLPQIVGE